MQHKASILRLKNEIKYLYIKQQHLNQQLLKLHLLLANSQSHLLSAWKMERGRITHATALLRCHFITLRLIFFVYIIFKNISVKNYHDPH